MSQTTGLIPGFSSPPIVLRCDVRLKTSLAKAGASADIADPPAPRLTRISRPRSNNGCRTCRIRKVKCDEIHPRCGPCTRLAKECHWSRQWRFQDDSPRVHRKYELVKTVVHDPTSQIIENQALAQMKSSASTLPSFASLADDTDRERKALLRKPGTYNVILTPDSFARLPEYGGIRRDSSASSKLKEIKEDAHSDGHRDDPDVIILSEFENTPYVRFTPAMADSPAYRDSRSVNVMFQVSHVPEIARDIGNYSIRDRDNTKHLHIYKTTILKRIMPLGTRFNLHIGAGNEDVVLALTRNFRPLYHAVCAITMLTLALRGQPSLLTGAFRHYDQAIAACLSCTNIDSDEFFYLHFLLLLYDICCATQNWPEDRRMWAQHLEHLSRIVHKKRDDGRPISRLKAYVSWYILFLDSQSCLAGNLESGSYVRAYIANGCWLPQWPLGDTGNRKAPITSKPGAFLSIHLLALHLFTAAAQLSQLALGMRQDDRHYDPVIIKERQIQVDKFCCKLRADWLERCPHSMQPDRGGVPEQNIPQISRSTFEFAQLQYSIMALYLHTSMYPGQRLHTAHYLDEDIYHCKFILSTASKAIANKDTINHHMVTAIFLTGFVSRDGREKRLAVELLEAMEDTGISRSVSRSLELLRIVQHEQYQRVAEGGLMEEIDWMEVARTRGIKSINFGL